MSTTVPAFPFAALWSAGASARPAPPPKPHRPNPGPVLMCDIHTGWGGQPGLLMLWSQWEDAAASRDDTD